MHYFFKKNNNFALLYVKIWVPEVKWVDLKIKKPQHTTKSFQLFVDGDPVNQESVSNIKGTRSLYSLCPRLF